MSPLEYPNVGNGAAHTRRAPKRHKLTRAERLHTNVHESLAFAGRMVYSMSYPTRQELFHRKPNDYAGAGADCSQYVAAELHWVGVKSVTDYDYTGSLWSKGKLLTRPEPMCVVIFGPPPGEHTGFITGRTPNRRDWYVVGFGWQGAPDRTTLSGNVSYFRERGFPGVRYLAFV